MPPGSGYLPANVERFCGVADTYDSYRPQPPRVLIDILSQLAGVARPHLVIDVGSGTGLSTRFWAGHADEVIGIEPNADMRKRAQARTAAEPNMESVHYREGHSTATGLPDASADIVTCSQSLHWMEPEPTFKEIARILRPGGVFAAYDCDWPPAMNWQAEVAYKEFDTNAEKIGESQGWFRGVKQWPKKEHLARMIDSGRFRYVREILVHNQETGNADRLVGLMASQAGFATLLKNGMTEAEVGFDEFRAACKRILGDERIPWYFSYRVRIGIK